MDLALCTGAQSCWNRKGPSPNCSHKVGSMELSNISWYAEAFRVPFTGTKVPSPAPEEQPHTIRPPPNLTLGTMQSDKYNSPGNRQNHTRPSDRSAIRHSRERVSTALESSGGVRYITASDALHCTCWCMAWKQQLGHGNPFYEALYTHCSWADLKATWSLEVCSDWLCRKLATSLLTLLRHFTWPTTLWLSCCRSQSLPLCYYTTDCGIFLNWTCCTGGILSEYHAGIHWAPENDRVSCRNSLHAEVLAFIHLWPRKWLERLISFIWMGESILLEI